MAVTPAAVYVGGDFTNIGGVARASLAKLDKSDGGPLPGWNPGAARYIFTLHADDEYVYAGGNFDTLGGQPIANAGRISRNTGVVDTNWAPMPNGTVYGVISQPPYVSLFGYFNQVDGVLQQGFARLSHELPQVAITNPVPGIEHWRQSVASITLQAEAQADTGLSITQVVYFANGARIGAAADAPYTCVWAPVYEGQYAVTAVTYDEWGLAGTSAVPVNLMVEPLVAAADFDGDGKADPAVYHTGSGKWVVMMSGAQYAMMSALWGGAGCRPEPGDYDGDGRADPMVRQVASGVWGVMFSGSHYAGMQATLGGAGGAWQPVSATCNQSFYFLCFGDSITYGYGSSSQSPATGYPILLENKLNENFGDYFISINVGKDGEDTGEGIGRFPTMLDTYVPQLVLLMEGINDLGGSRSYSQIAGNLRSMIGAAQDRGMPLVLATISPVISTATIDRSAQYARILEFNPQIYDIAADLDIPVAQVYEAITAVSGWQSSLIEAESANHPNDAGYRHVRDAFYSVVASGINSGLYY